MASNRIKNHKAQLKRQVAKLGLLAFLLFLGMSLVAYFHAYKFTHFSYSSSLKTSDPKELSFSQKIKTALFGIDNPRPKNSAYPHRRFEIIRIQSNKKIELWWIPHASPKGSVILCHGYSGEKSSLITRAEIFHKFGYNCLLIDFMGSGGSAGNQCTLGFWESEQVKSAVEYLKEKGEKNVLLFGNSMGAAAIMRAEAKGNLGAKGLILECPFGSMQETVEARFHNMGLPSFPMADLLVFWGGAQNGFNAFAHNPSEYASKISTPTLLLYGQKDDKVSQAETDSIFLHLKGKKILKIYPLAGHENYLNQYAPEWEGDVREFLESL